MYDLLRSIDWQLISALIGVLGLLVTLRLHWRVKSLTYDILDETKLLTEDDVLEGKTLQFKGEAIPDPHRVVVRITNSAKTPIKKEDIEQSLSFSFGHSAAIVTGKFVAASPENFRPKISFASGASSANIEDTSFNPKDSFVVQFLLSNYRNGDLAIGGRVIGLPKFRQIRSRRRLGYLLLILLVFAGPLETAMGKALSFLPQDSWALFAAIIVAVVVACWFLFKALILHLYPYMYVSKGWNDHDGE